MTGDEPSLLELGQHAVDGGKSELLVLLQQQPIDALRAQMAFLARLQDFQDLQPR
jgi:hypothetical protein